MTYLGEEHKIKAKSIAKYRLRRVCNGRIANFKINH